MKNKKAFTLVELIVVVTILWILSTIWFVAYSWYLVWVRDTNRTSQLKSISDGLELYRTKHSLPLPDDYVEVKANGEVIAYQWYAWKNVLESIEYTSEWVDPKDKSYYSYYLTKDKKYYQLMWFLEEQSETEVAWLFTRANALDYSIRYPTVYGKKLWILTDKNNTPIQEINNIKSSWYLDIVNTNDTYIARFKDSITNLSWTWVIFTNLPDSLKGGWLYGSCKAILDKKKSLKWKNGDYMIFDKNLSKILNVYCDMTTDWGGWTLVLKANWANSTFAYNSNYWITNNTLNEWFFTYDTNEFKSSLFNTQGFSEINLELDTWSFKNNLVIHKSWNSLLDIFNWWYKTIDIKKNNWLDLVLWSSLQPNCNNIGFNLPGYSKARIWISANNENDCNSNDSVLWIGLTTTNSVWSKCSYWCLDSYWNSQPDNHMNSFWYLYIR